MMGYGQAPPHHSHPSGYDPHAEYELVFQAVGTVEEYGSLACRQGGIIRVIQGPKQLDVKTMDGYTSVFSFLSINSLNIPLLPDQTARFVEPYLYSVNVTGRTFFVALERTTPDELMREFEKILSWFCSFQGAHTHDNNSGKPGGMARKIDSAGNKGVDLVERLADRVQAKLARTLEPRLRAAREAETRQVSIGGRATAGVLGGTRSVVGKVAGVAGVVTDKAASAVGTVLARNPVMNNLRNAPQDSRRHSLHESLTAGMVSVGKVYVACDEKGRAVVSTWGDNSAEVLREKYGDQVAGAAQDSTRIAVDSYRIMRFPAKLGVAPLLKGAAKASAHNNGNGRGDYSNDNFDSPRRQGGGAYGYGYGGGNSPRPHGFI